MDRHLTGVIVAVLAAAVLYPAPASVDTGREQVE